MLNTAVREGERERSCRTLKQNAKGASGEVNDCKRMQGGAKLGTLLDGKLHMPVRLVVTGIL